MLFQIDANDVGVPFHLENYKVVMLQMLVFHLQRMYVCMYVLVVTQFHGDSRSLAVMVNFWVMQVESSISKPLEFLWKIFLNKAMREISIWKEQESGEWNVWQWILNASPGNTPEPLFSGYD